MILTSIYIKLRNWWDYMTATNVDNKKLDETIIITEVDMPSDSETDHKPYNDYY